MAQTLTITPDPWLGQAQAAVDIEYLWISSEAATAHDPYKPTLVFLHEGLGSVAMWRDFPARLCQASGLRGLVYSRPGYGASTPRPAAVRWGCDFMHQQALSVLPALLRALAVENYHLVGHSDGGSISLIHAAAQPAGLQKLVVIAPHILVESISVTSIRAAREAYLEGDLRHRLARFHHDVDSAFWGWNDIWLAPEFLTWSLQNEVRSLQSPVLAIQGEDDQYGTMVQIEGIATAHAATTLFKMPGCGHSPHRDNPEGLIAVCAQFFGQSEKL